jgi:hypothetical protein
MTVIENYKGVNIASAIVCYNIRYFVMNKLFTHFDTIEEAREDIDNTIHMGIAYDWIAKNKEYIKHIDFSRDDLIQIGINISSMNK